MSSFHQPGHFGNFLRTSGGAFTGPLLGPNGAVGAPSYSFANFATTGFYIAAGPELNVAVGGSLIARWSASGFFVSSGSILCNTFSSSTGNTGVVAMNMVQELTEQADPSAPAANKCRLYAKDNGAGKTQLVALFPTGTAVEIAVEA